METITFDKLLLRTTFCCMAADGDIDKREIESLRLMCKKSHLLKDINFDGEINYLVNGINSEGKAFIQQYFKLLSNTNLSEQEELTLIDFALQTIYADEQVLYSEIKFFKNIRHRLKIGDEKILERFPGIEQFLEEDIITESFLDKITSQYLELIELPQFDLINTKAKEE